jgi:hypothetical protein
VPSNIYRLAGRVGGYARAARYDGREMTVTARQRFAESFLEGHSCRVCPEVTLPADLLPEERARRAEALRKAHYARVALASSRARKKKPAPCFETVGSGQGADRGGPERAA